MPYYLNKCIQTANLEGLVVGVGGEIEVARPSRLAGCFYRWGAEENLGCVGLRGEVGNLEGQTI